MNNAAARTQYLNWALETPLPAERRIMTPSKDWIYCPKCRQEICVTKCRKEIKKEEHWEVGNPLSGGYLDDYWYEKVIDTYHILYCPNDNTELRNSHLDRHWTGERQCR